jgi:hypothetical protein
VERIGREEGVQQGIQQGKREGLLEAVEMGLSLRFGSEGEKLLPEIRLIEDSERLEKIKNAVRAANDLAQVKALLN